MRRSRGRGGASSGFGRERRSRAKLIPEMGAEELGYLFDAYVHILKDSRLVRGALARIANERINAEDAIRIEVALIAEAFKQMDDAYLVGRVEDIREIGNRLIAFLLKKEDVKPVVDAAQGLHPRSPRN